jgi:hypothetical protein
MVSLFTHATTSTHHPVCLLPPVILSRAKDLPHRDGVDTSSTSNWYNTMQCAVESVSRLGSPWWRIDTQYTSSADKQQVSNGWSMPCASSSSGTYGFIGCLNLSVLLLPRRRLILALDTPANLFSDLLRPAYRVQKRCVQKMKSTLYQ